MNMAPAQPIPHEERVLRASREVAAPAARIFALIADPTEQPRWDGNDNLAEAASGQRVRAVGDVFVMTNRGGGVRENHVVAFAEEREIAWMPAPQGEVVPGHRWGWELEALDGDRTLVTHTYDFSQLNEEKRLAKARSFTAGNLRASIDRLALLAERNGGS